MNLSAVPPTPLPRLDVRPPPPPTRLRPGSDPAPRVLVDFWSS